MSANQNSQPRAYAAAHFALELDGGDEVGLFRSIEGGGVKADVMTYQQGNNYDRWRQLGKPKFEDIKIQVGMAMSEPFYEWISNFFDGKADRKNGAIVAADFYYNERARREFTEAMIKELTFPKLDGQDKNAAYMSISIAVEGIVFKKGDEGKKLSVPVGFDTQKLWTACNFRFRLDGFESACKRVTKIDSFTKRGVGGEVRPAEQLTGVIETYDNERADLFTLTFTGADIANVAPDKSESSSEEIKMVKIDLYTESMKFKYS
jgi:phage tail-like protein